MKRINKATSKARKFVRNYETAKNCGELWQVYGRYSHNKVRALEYCKALVEELNGYDGRICSFNTFTFAYGFRYMDGETEQLAYITPSYDYTTEYK